MIGTIINAEVLLWVVLVTVACLFVLAFWAIIAGDHRHVEDDDPTLNTRGKD